MTNRYLTITCASLVMIIRTSGTLHGFNTLAELKEYAQSKPESVGIDNDDWLNPDFTNFYKQEGPSFIDRMLRRVGLKKQAAWTLESFKQQLDQLTQYRQNSGESGRFVYAIKPPIEPDSHYIIWGTLQGAFHSLVRDLEQLNNHGIINNQLRIEQPNYYFVFNGNTVNRSPYSLQTLSAMMSIMERNPGKVVYIKGDQEYRGHWRNFTMRKQLALLTTPQEFESIIQNIDQFFDTLPLALYLIPSSQPASGAIDLVRISHYEQEREKWNEAVLEEQLKKGSFNKLTKIPLDSSGPTPGKIAIQAIIRGDSRAVPSYRAQGLFMQEPDRGSMAWTVVSSPTSAYQKNYAFFDDAFAELSTAKSLAQWRIKLWHHDTRTKSPVFKESTEYLLVSGQESSIGLDNSKPLIHLGTSMDLSKQIKFDSQAIRDGLSMRFDEEARNKSAPIRYQLTLLDDAYTPVRARENIIALMNDNIDIILAPNGTPTLANYIDLVEDKKIAVLFPRTGGTMFRKPIENLIHLTPAYDDEAFGLMTYAIKNLHADNIAIFFQNDAYGLSGVAGVKRVLEKHPVQHVEYIPYHRNETNFAQQVKAIKGDSFDTIMLIATDQAAREFIHQVGVHSLAAKNLIAISPVSTPSFRRFIRSKGLPITIVDLVPNPETSQLQIVQEFRAAAQKMNKPLGALQLFAYISASLLIDAINHIKGPITQKTIMQAFEARFKEPTEFKGLKLWLDPKTRALSRTIWLDTGKGEWLELSTQVPEEKTGASTMRQTPTDSMTQADRST